MNQWKTRIAAVLLSGIPLIAGAQSLPDLSIQGVYLNSQGQVTVRIKNLGARLPDEVYTQLHPQSTSVLLSRENQNWGGVTLWNLDPERQLQAPGGEIVWTSNLRVSAGTRIEARLDSTQQVAEVSEHNNNWSGRVYAQQPVAGADSGPTAPYLSNGSAFNLDKVKTIATMQEHIQWISQPSEQDVLASLRSRGYQVEGNQLMTSESNDPYLRELTTERLRSYVAVQGNNVVICFRGTLAKGNALETLGNALTDGNILKSSPSFFLNTSALTQAQRNSRVHLGFNNAYWRLRPNIVAALQPHGGKQVYVFGHSLGGALASLCALDIRINFGRDFRSVTHIASGAPRVGDRVFCQTFESQVPNNLRFVIQGDPVAMVPRATLPGIASTQFVHAGRLIHIGEDGVAIRPDDIETRLARSRANLHANTAYFEAAQKLLQRASQPGYFQGKSRLPEQMAEAERKKSQ